MFHAYLGAALFLAGALPLTTRHVVPAHRRDPVSIVAMPSSRAGMSDPGAAARVLGERMSAARTAPLGLCVGAGVVAAASVVMRHGGAAPLYSMLVVVLLPVFVALSSIDIAEHRLPNRLTGATAVITAGGLALVRTVNEFGDSDAGRRAVVGAVTLGGFYLLLALLGRGQGMGLGDVKLAPSLGALTAVVSWNTWLTASVVTFVLGGLWGVGLMVAGRGRTARMAFGPFMMAGTLWAVCVA